MSTMIALKAAIVNVLDEHPISYTTASFEIIPNINWLKKMMMMYRKKDYYVILLFETNKYYDKFCNCSLLDKTKTYSIIGYKNKEIKERHELKAYKSSVNMSMNFGVSYDIMNNEFKRLYDENCDEIIVIEGMPVFFSR